MFHVSANAQRPIGEVESGGDAAMHGSIVLTKTGTRVMSGTEISAGSTTAVLKLARGGEIQICPKTSVTVSSSNSGAENLVALNAGSIEAHYQLASSADTIMTPDFRILLAGPGTFNFGFGLAVAGDVCVKSLPGSTSSVIVSEMFGEGTHQVKPGEQVVFHAGKVENVAQTSSQRCGCPENEPPAVKTAMEFPEQESKRAAEAAASGRVPVVPVEAAALPPETKPGQVTMQVEAPVIFESEEPPPTPASLARPNIASLQLPSQLSAQPPPRPEAKPWYRKIGGVFARMFGKKSSS
jgi:ribosomal protein L27